MLTMDPNCACAVVNNITSILQADFKEFLEDSFTNSKRLFGYHVAKLGEASVENPLQALFKQRLDEGGSVTSGDSLPHAMANVAVAGTYVTKFRTDCLDSFDRTLRGHADRRAMFQQCLGAFDLISAELADLHTTTVKYLLHQVRGTHISPFINAMEAVDYDIDEEAFSDMQVNDPVVRSFIASLDGLLRWVSAVSVPETIKAFSSLLCDYVAIRLDRSILQSRSKYSLLGATQLYQDVARLVSFFAENTEVPVKAKFGRLQELCSILCLESIGEFKQIYSEGFGAGPLQACKISVKDVRSILSLRAEFTHDAIVTTII